MAPTDSFVNPARLPSSFGLSLVRGVSAGCYQPLLPAGPSRRYLCESFPGCLGLCHGGFAECTCLFLPPRHRPSPVHYRGRLPACARRNDFTTDRFSRLQPFLYVQAPRFARLPDRSYRCDLTPQSSRGFYVRAEHASLPPRERGRTCVALTETRPGRCGTPSPARYRSPYGLTITGRLSSYASKGERSIATG